MNCIELILRRLLNAAWVSLLFATAAWGEPMLLATLRMHGGGGSAPEPVARLSTGFFAGGLGVHWVFFATTADVGKSVSVPDELLPDFDTALTYSGGDLVGNMNYMSEIGEIFSTGLTNGTQRDRVMIDRIAPVRGLNFSGYRISDLVATVDELMFGGPPGQNMHQGAWSLRVYGEAIPPIPGDFNINGGVDAADYVVWRDRVAMNDVMPNGTGTGLFAGRAVAEDYNWWRLHFGSHVTFSSSESFPIPESSSLWLLICAALGCSCRHRRPHSCIILACPDLQR
jgi:hypothetical protein